MKDGHLHALPTPELDERNAAVDGLAVMLDQRAGKSKTADFGAAIGSPP
jgi:hypothetical protein